MTEKELKTAIVQLRLTPTLKAAIERAAAADHRSVNAYMEKLATEHAEKNGYLRRSAA